MFGRIPIRQSYTSYRCMWINVTCAAHMLRRIAIQCQPVNRSISRSHSSVDQFELYLVVSVPSQETANFVRLVDLRYVGSG
jgi:hypothetical protein